MRSQASALRGIHNSVMRGWFLAAACLVMACGPRPPGADTLDLAAHLTQKHVRRSPFIETPDAAEAAVGRYGAQVFRDSDDRDHRGGNPFGIVRKVRVSDQTWNSILAPPETVLEFPIGMQPTQVLQFGFVGMLEPGRDSAEVGVHVYLRSGRTTRTVLSRNLTVDRRSSGTPFFERIGLVPEKTQDAKLVLATTFRSGGPPDSCVCAWLSPHLFVPHDSTRNVVLISLDTVRWDYVGLYTDQQTFTPRIDALSQDAVVFENAYAQSPWTLPSHASIFTGVNPNVHSTNTFSSKLPSGLRTIPQMFKERGYRCHAYTGDGPVSHRFGFAKGFDLFKEGDGILLPDACTPIYRRAAEFIRATRGQDFFLFLHTFQFHEPLMSPGAMVDSVFRGTTCRWRTRSLDDLRGPSKYKPLSGEETENIRLLYHAEIKTIDELLIGPLVRLLKDEGLYDQTTIVIMSDHGEEIADHGGWGHGHSLYNEITKVPLLVKLQSSRHGGTRIRANVRLIDVLPTVLEDVGIPPPDGQIDGKSLLPLIEGREREPRACFSEFTPVEAKQRFPGRVSVVLGDHKLILNDSISDWAGLFDYPPPRLAPVELYDLRSDPLERINVYAETDSAASLLGRISDQYRGMHLGHGEALPLDSLTVEKLRAVGYVE